MSKQQSGSKNAFPPMLPFGPHPQMFHPQLHALPMPRQKGDKPNALDLSRKSVSNQSLIDSSSTVVRQVFGWMSLVTGSSDYRGC